MENVDIKKALNDKANSSPVFKTICTLLSGRERARYQLTAHSLQRSCALAGAHYPKPQIEEILEFMAKCDLGKLSTANKKTGWELNDIKYTLQSIGSAALDPSKNLVNYHNGKLDPKPVTVKKETTIRRPAPKSTFIGPPKEKLAETKAYIETLVNGRKVTLPLARSLTMEELGSFMVKLFSK